MDPKSAIGTDLLLSGKKNDTVSHSDYFRAKKCGQS